MSVFDRNRNLASGLFALLAVCGCADDRPASQLSIALTVDWEGAYISPEGLDAIEDLRETLGNPPITHFISAAYFTKATPVSSREIASVLRPGDEVAVHLHAWKSLVTASGVEAAEAPSFLNGTDELMTFDDGDRGLDVDLDAYSIAELRAQLATSRGLLGQAGLTVSRSFRAGGYLGTPKVLQAVRDEGFTVDSSAVEARTLEGAPWQERIAQLWPDARHPHTLDVAGGSLRELPIAAIADYATADDIAAVLVAAAQRHARVPDEEALVVLAFHQETGQFAQRITDAVAAARERYPHLVFVTVEDAAARLRGAR